MKAPKSKMIETINKLIADGLLAAAAAKLSDAFTGLQDSGCDNADLEELIASTLQQSTRLATVKQNQLLGTYTSSEANTETNKISKAIIHLLGKLKSMENGSVISTKEKQATTTKSPLPPAEPLNEPVKSKKRTTRLVIADDFDSYTEEKQQILLNAIKELLKLDDDLEIKKISKGSVVIEFDIPEDKYEDLLRSFGKGNLNELKVVEVDGFKRYQTTPIIDILKTPFSIHDIDKRSSVFLAKDIDTKPARVYNNYLNKQYLQIRELLVQGEIDFAIDKLVYILNFPGIKKELKKECKTWKNLLRFQSAVYSTSKDDYLSGLMLDEKKEHIKHKVVAAILEILNEIEITIENYSNLDFIQAESDVSTVEQLSSLDISDLEAQLKSNFHTYSIEERRNILAAIALFRRKSVEDIGFKKVKRDGKDEVM